MADPFLNPGLNSVFRELDERYGVVDESEKFRQLVNFSLASTQPYHGWAQYREGFSGLLVRDLIRRSSLEQKAIILDPMSGSGTTLVTARENHYDAIGIDVNDFSVYLTESKMADYSSESLKLAMATAERIQNERSAKSIKSAEQAIENASYFEPQHFAALLGVKSRLDDVADAGAKRLLFTAWLCALEPCSNRKRDGNGLATRRTRVGDATEFFYYKLRQIVTDLINHPLSRETKGVVLRGSAISCSHLVTETSQKMGRNVGMVVFSPPYMNSFDYFESYKIELLMGGFITSDMLPSRKKDAIRNFRQRVRDPITVKDGYLRAIVDELHASIPKKEALTGVVDDRTRLMAGVIPAYFHDMRQVLIELNAIIQPEGFCYIVVDQSAYAGVLIPTDQLLARIAEDIGFRVRGLIYCRKATTSGQQLRMFPHLNGHLRETILVLQR